MSRPTTLTKRPVTFRGNNIMISTAPCAAATTAAPPLATAMASSATAMAAPAMTTVTTTTIFYNGGTGDSKRGIGDYNDTGDNNKIPATISVTPETTTSSPTIVTATLATIAAPVMAAAYPIRIVVTTRSMVSTKPRHPHHGNLPDLLACPIKRDKLGTTTICLINAPSLRNSVVPLWLYIRS